MDRDKQGTVMLRYRSYVGNVSMKIYLMSLANRPPGSVSLQGDVSCNAFSRKNQNQERSTVPSPYGKQIKKTSLGLKYFGITESPFPVMQASTDIFFSIDWSHAFLEIQYPGAWIYLENQALLGLTRLEKVCQCL